MSARAAVKPLAGLELGGEPRVNLLPPEVGERVRIRRTRGVLVALAVLSVGLVAVGYSFATLTAIGAGAALAGAQARTSELLAERAEYAQVSSLLSASATIEEVRANATVGEVVWADVLDEVTAILGEDGFTSNGYYKWSALSAAPWATPLAPGGDLRAPRVATITLTVQSANPIESTSLARRIAQLDMVADVSVDASELPQGEMLWQTTMTINLNEKAISSRNDESSDADATADEVAGQDEGEQGSEGEEQSDEGQ